jgi:phospholipase/lecithinase/hemolysin
MTSHAHAAGPFSDLIVFGGPLEDVGNLASIAGPLPAPFFQNRLTNGPVAVDILAARLGLTVKPSLHLVGPVQGNNFASAEGHAAGNQPQDLAGQVDAYFTTTGGRADPNALYYVIIGGNDVIQATYDEANAEQIVAAAVQAKEIAIRRLVTSGARTILVPNFINIGITPRIRLAGLAERGAMVSAYHNELMKEMLDRVERELDFALIRDDFAHLTESILNSSEILRFTNTTEPCLAVLPLGQCDLNRFVFINDIFPTARVHELWANQLTFAIMEHNFAKKKKKHKRGRS